MLGGSKKMFCVPGYATETDPKLCWMSPVKVQVSSGLPQGQGLSVQETWSHSLWDKSFRRRSPLIPPQGHWADNPQNVEQLHQRNPSTAKKVLGSTKDFPTWGFGKGTKNPKGIWLWRPVGFDYRNYTKLWKQLLKDTKKTLCIPGPRRKEQWPHKRLTQTCLWMPRSLQERSELGVACCSVEGSRGGIHYLKYLHHILVSVDGWSCVPSLLFTWGQTMVKVIKTMATSFKRSLGMYCYTQGPQPCNRPPLTHASAGDSWTLQGKSGSVSCGVTAPLCCVLVHTKLFNRKFN